MSSLNELTGKLKQGINLEMAETDNAARLLTDPSHSIEERRDFLLALHQKGESVEEVVAFARVFREFAKDPGLDDYAPKAIDIVGTGGSGSGGYNISSVTAMILAAGGITVLKHGNRAITSKSGAADFLTTLGIYIQDNPDVLRRSVERLNFCFFFAPSFHPSFKEIMPVRKALAEEGHRTIFNMLGPLINPARPAFQLLGVHGNHWVKPLADAMTQLLVKGGISVHCALSDGKPMDELSTAGSNRVSGIGRNADIDGWWDPVDFGFTPTSHEELTGGSPEENAALLEDMLKGNGRNGLMDTICLNAGTGFFLMEQARSIEAGCARAREILLGGELRDWLRIAREFYLPYAS